MPRAQKGQRFGGRKQGTLNKTTVERQIRAARGVQAALDGGLLPLDVILSRMRDEPLPNGKHATDAQYEAARDAAPYLHPRLASTDTTVKSDNVHRVVAAEPITKEAWTEKYAAGAEPVTIANDDAA